MGFASFIAGVGLMILAVLLAVLGFVVLLGFIKLIAASFDVPLGIVILIVALILFAYGWYLYKSGYPRGTINVHNQ
jgi:high-affinity Fe2+/Pb2+ permease